MPFIISDINAASWALLTPSGTALERWHERQRTNDVAGNQYNTEVPLPYPTVRRCSSPVSPLTSVEDLTRPSCGSLGD
jgi:hypothetical protein